MVKIGPSFDARRTGEATNSKPSAVAGGRAEAPVTRAADVRLSDLSTKLADLEARLAGSEAFDATRIEEIKQAIAEGRFKVNPEAVADKLLANIREMLTGNKQ